MEPKPSSSKALPKIRTFADDLKRLNPTADTEPEVIPASKKPVAIPKARAARAIPNVVRQAEPTAIPKPPKLPIPTKQQPPPIPPAFHTLQKTTPGSVPRAIPKKPVRGEIEITGSGEDYAGTTIIKDTVRRRTNIFSAIGESLGTAGRDFKRFWKKANQPLYVVPDAERRKGVIQQATSQSGKTFTADYDRLKERLRQRAEQSDIVPEQDISWSPLTEPGFNLLPGDTSWDTQVSNVVVEPRRTHTISPATPVTPPPKKAVVAEKLKPILQKKTVAPAPAIPPPVVIEPKPVATGDPMIPPPSVPVPEPVALPVPTPPPAPKVVTQPIAAPAPVIPIADTAVTEPETSTFAEPQETELEEMSEPIIEEAQMDVEELVADQRPVRPVPTREATQLFNQVTTNTLTIAIAGGLVAVVLVVVIVIRIADIVWSNNTEVPSAAEIAISAVSTHPLVPVSYTITAPESLISALSSAAAAANQPTHELYVTQPDGSVWTPSQLLAAQNLTLSPSFGASLTDIRWITENGSIIGLVFTYTNPTQIRGSLLGWETTIGAELGRLLPTPDTRTSGFTDQQLAQTDVRTASNGITYGLVSDRYGIIALSGDAFTSIASALTK